VTAEIILSGGWLRQPAALIAPTAKVVKCVIDPSQVAVTDMCTRPDAIISAARIIAGRCPPGRRLGMAQPKAAHAERLEDNFQRADDIGLRLIAAS
jgi:hypothetical protein